jgi:DNA processing protein
MNKDVRDRLIQIHQCRHVYWNTLHQFLKLDSTLKKIYKLSKKDLERFFTTSSHVNAFYEDLHHTSADELLKKYRQGDVKTITIADDLYPPVLKSIYDPPWTLYYKGDITLLHESKIISIVGTRMPSLNGMKSARLVLEPLVDDQWVIVSGLAYGIDTLAHQVCVSKRGKTIAVLGSGFNHIYPNKNAALASEIARNHLLLSEYPPFVKPQKWHFPMRNRIISGLSLGTIIIEAKEKSGSLITAHLALEQGREVFAVPGSIVDPSAKGTNQLIQQGAYAVLHGNDVVNYFYSLNTAKIGENTL